MRLLNLFYLKQFAIWALIFNRRDVAIRCWESMRTLQPNDASIPASIAHLKAELGLVPQAIGLLYESLDRKPDQHVVWYNLGYLHQSIDEQEKAIFAFNQAILLNDKADLAMYGKALSLIKLGQVEQAIPLLKRNTELQPLSPYGWYQLAHVYYRLGQTDKLKGVIQKVFRFEPTVARQLQVETGLDVTLCL
jgi:tetratricopeptide (TPR) repeat protein